jgi:hypothetical protein
MYWFSSVYSTNSQVNIDTLRQYSAFPPPLFPHPPLYSDSHANGTWYLLFCAVECTVHKLHIHRIVIIVIKANVVEFQARRRECLQDKRYIP